MMFLPTAIFFLLAVVFWIVASGLVIKLSYQLAWKGGLILPLYLMILVAIHMLVRTVIG